MIGVTFTRDAARRTRRAVITTEQIRRDFTGLRRGASVLDATVWRVGTLDADLAYDETDGVDVSEYTVDWSDYNGVTIENVLPPPWMTSGTISSGTVVAVARRADGVEYVVAAEC